MLASRVLNKTDEEEKGKTVMGSRRDDFCNEKGNSRVAGNEQGALAAVVVRTDAEDAALQSDE